MIVWLNKPVLVDANPDIKIWRVEQKRRVRPDEFVIADDGSVDATVFYSRYVAHSIEFHEVVRARHERETRQLKRFGVLTKPFRHKR